MNQTAIKYTHESNCSRSTYRFLLLNQLCTLAKNIILIHIETDWRQYKIVEIDISHVSHTYLQLCRSSITHANLNVASVSCTPMINR